MHVSESGRVGNPPAWRLRASGAPAYLRPGMSKLLSAIRADAERLLPLEAGRRPCQEVERFQRFLKRQWMRVRLAHNEGAGGRAVCEARTLAVDLVFHYALQAAASLPEYAAGARPRPWSVAALGGYGRRELSPHSDIDVQFVHDRADVKVPPAPPFMALLEDSWLFNVFPKVQALVRTPAQCVDAANQDLRSKTSLTEARLVCGSEPLFAAMEKRLISGAVKGWEDAFIDQRMKDQGVRRERYGNTPFLQEPNVKNGCGGLRDYQNLLWLAFFRYRVRATADLEHRRLITARERSALDAAYEFLLRVRNDLHFRSDRPNDVLGKNVQPAVARAMGFHNGSPWQRLERLMRAYYGHVRNVHDITRTVEERLALLPQPGRLPRLRHLLRERRKRAAYELEGFKFVDGTVMAASDHVFRGHPERLVRAFHHAQRKGFRLDPELLQKVRDRTDLVTPAFRDDPKVRETFLDLFRHPGRVGGTLRAMHEAGLLGALVPAFGRLTGQVQHEFFHQFTVDEHTLVCLEKLDAIAAAQEPPLAPYGEVFRRLQHPELLYLALLLHDTGKGEGHGHAESGARIAATVTRRLRLDPDAGRRIEFLVRHHLDMVTVSQKRDLDDPHVIRQFAALAGDLENLHALTLLTLADSLATSDKLWNAFKDQLLLMLHARAAQELQGTVPVEAAAARDRLLAEVRKACPAEIQPDEIEAHFESLPPGYFQHATVTEVVADLGVAHELVALQVLGQEHPFTPAIRHEALPVRGCTVVRCCARDHHGLFAQLTGAFTAAGLNILGADIYTRRDDLALDRFYVADPDTGGPPSERLLDKFRQQAREALTGHLDVARLLHARRQKQPPLNAAPGGGRLPTRISFDNDSSPSRSIIEIEAEDRLGLLHTISATLADLGVDIALARIHTANGAASDAFYVTETGGVKILAPARQRQIRVTLEAAIAALG